MTLKELAEFGTSTKALAGFAVGAVVVAFSDVAVLQETYLYLRFGKTELEINAVQGMGVLGYARFFHFTGGG
jgi:hypothetical protein